MTLRIFTKKKVQQSSELTRKPAFNFKNFIDCIFYVINNVVRSSHFLCVGEVAMAVVDLNFWIRVRFNRNRWNAAFHQT